MLLPRRVEPKWPESTCSRARSIKFLGCVKSRRHVIPDASAKAREVPQHMRHCSRDPRSRSCWALFGSTRVGGVCVEGGGRVSARVVLALVGPHVVYASESAPPTPVDPDLARDIAGAECYFFPHRSHLTCLPRLLIAQTQIRTHVERRNATDKPKRPNLMRNNSVEN